MAFILIVLLIIIAMIGNGGGGIRDQIIVVDPNMVVVDITELKFLVSVELLGEDIVGEVADVARIEANVLVG